jgi:hypothetical protein
MGTHVFLSYSIPVFARQRLFIEALGDDLRARELEPRTLGVTDYDSDSPLLAIRRVMLETNGLLCVAFRRREVVGGHSETAVSQLWTTSPYCHIEAAMAFEFGLPVVMLTEAGVMREGVLREGVIGPRVPPIDLARPIRPYFRSKEWLQTAAKWELQVRTVLDRKGHPRQWY